MKSSIERRWKMNVLSLFCGCGGMDSGVEQAGHRVIWANDIACILEGETPEQAFKRKTGRGFDDKEPTEKPEAMHTSSIHIDDNVNAPNLAKKEVNRILGKLPEDAIKGVKVTVKRRLEHGAVGLYDVKDAEIQLEADMLRRPSSRTTKMVFHEVGHHKYLELNSARRSEWGSLYQESDKTDLPTDYARTSVFEGFAECYADYQYYGTATFDKKSEIQKWFKRNVKRKPKK